jgi:DNA-binding SARP family transcriptional activator
MAHQRGERGHDPASGRVSVLGAFEWCRDGVAMPVTSAAQRLIAFLVLRRRPATRSTVAGILWPDSTEDRAASSLRTELWKLGKGDSPVSLGADGRLLLDPRITDDLHDAIDLANRVLDGGVTPPVHEFRSLLLEDLLPDWAEDWVAIERERFHQLRLHALEALCARQAGERRFAAAVQAGLAAVDADPYRESSRRALIAAYLEEGNVHAAVDQYQAFQRLLADDLAAEPTTALRSLIDGAVPSLEPLTRR